MSLRWIGLRRYTRNNIKAFVLLDVLIALGLMATFLIIIYQLKVQNIDRVENINNILTRERAVRNFLIAEPFISTLSVQNHLHETWSIKSLNNNEVEFINLSGNEYIYLIKDLP